MSNVVVEKNRYTVESLYQWDKDQVLQISGLSLPAVPEIHFTNDAMNGAIVVQSEMDSSGVVTASIPNSLLQKPYKIKAYVCVYEGDTFETLYLIEIPVKARNKPLDYTIEDDEEIYSFNELRNFTYNEIYTLKGHVDTEISALKTYVDEEFNALLTDEELQTIYDEIYSEEVSE